MKPTDGTRALLAWYVEAGADEAIGEVAVNRYQSKPRLPENQPAAPRARFPAAAPKKPKFSLPAGAPLSTAGSVEQSARDIAAGAGGLEALKSALSNFDGCALRDTATNLVFADGNPQAGVMIIGEAPGADEDRQGRPFVGLAGQLLDRMLGAIDLDRSSAYITNILPWRPPGNRKPTPNEVTICLPFLRRHIELVDPKILVLVGCTSAQALLGATKGITRLRGRWHDYPGVAGPIPAMPIFHSAYLLRKPGMKRETWRDLCEIRHKLDTLTGR